MNICRFLHDVISAVIIDTGALSGRNKRNWACFWSALYLVIIFLIKPPISKTCLHFDWAQYKKTFKYTSQMTMDYYFTKYYLK